MSESIKSKIDAIARRLANKLDDDNAAFSDLLDGMRVLTAYYVATVKKTKPDDNDDSGANSGTFAAMKRGLREAAEGAGTKQ